MRQKSSHWQLCAKLFGLIERFVCNSQWNSFTRFCFNFVGCLRFRLAKGTSQYLWYFSTKPIQNYAKFSHKSEAQQTKYILIEHFFSNFIDSWRFVESFSIFFVQNGQSLTALRPWSSLPLLVWQIILKKFIEMQKPWAICPSSFKTDDFVTSEKPVDESALIEKVLMFVYDFSWLQHFCIHFHNANANIDIHRETAHFGCVNTIRTVSSERNKSVNIFGCCRVWCYSRRNVA